MIPRFTTDKCCLLVIDVQGRLADLMSNKQSLFKHIVTMINAAKILKIPIYWFEQYPKGLGPTKSSIKELLVDSSYHEKLTFSACGAKDFLEQLNSNGRNQFIVTGIETHVCVYQTVIDLLAKGFSVKVNQQAVSSRIKNNKNLGLHTMEKAGADITSTEMILFELMKTAKHPNFRQISQLLK
jgi:nicotinamidase-related amidase